MKHLLEVSEVELTYKSKVKASERPKVNSSQSSAEIFKAITNFENNIEFKELFYCMYLNRANKVLSVMKCSEGGTCGTVVDIKHIIQSAILQNAQALIVCHNHPSGNLRPSNEDILITKQIKDAAKYFNISVLDHLIITDESYYSFKDEGNI